MQFRHLSLLALAGSVFAQDQENNSTDSQSLNATLSGNDQLTNLTSFLNMAPALSAVLAQASNITILAPSDEAFTEFASTEEGQAIASDAEALAALLQYHVLNGTYTSDQVSNTSTFIPTLLQSGEYSNVTGGQVVEAIQVGNDVVFYGGLLQNATVTEADQNFTGGVVHIVDRVLAFPVSVLATASAANLTSFRGAINATDKIEDASQPDLTIFAPNNEAFQRIGSALRADNVSADDLRAIIDYHVVDGVYYSSDLENGTTLDTVGDGGELTITIVNGSVFVNAAEVITPNILIANGVLHIIDNVLNPDNATTVDEESPDGAPAFTGTADSEPPFTSGQPTPTTTINPTEEGAGPAATDAEPTETSGAAVPGRTTGGVEFAALFGVGVGVLFGV